MLPPASYLALLLMLVGVTAWVRDIHPGSVLRRLVHSEGKPQQLGPALFRIRQGAVSTPLGPPDVDLGNKMLATLERMRIHFPTGIDRIPPLDPFSIDHLEPIKINQFGLASADVRLSDLVVQGLQQFEVKGFEIRIKNESRLDFDVYFPTLEMYVLYNASITFLGALKYEPKGKAAVKTSGVRARGVVTLNILTAPDFEDHFAVTGLRLALDINGVQLKATGLMPSESINAVLNSVLNMVSSELFEKIKSQVSNNVSQLIMRRVNQLLTQYSAVAVIQRIAFD